MNTKSKSSYDFEITCEMFEESDLLHTSAAIHKDTNFKKFIECEDIDQFMKECIRNRNIPENFNIFHDRHSKTFITFINQNLQELIALTKDSNISAKEIYTSGDYHNFIRIIFKLITTRISYVQLNEMKINEAIDQMYEYTSTSFSFLDFILALYIRNHFSYLKIAAPKHKRFEQILDPYILLCALKFREEVYVNDLEKIYKEISLLEIEIKKKDKIIEQKKKKAIALYENLEKQKKTTKDLTNKEKKSDIEDQLLKEKELTIDVLNSQINDLRRRVKESVDVSEVNKLKKIISDLKAQNENLKIELSKQNEHTIYDTFKEHLESKGADDRLKQIIYFYFEDFIPHNKEPKQIIENNYKEIIGVCEIKNGTHYFRSLKNEYYEIRNIPEETYISQDGFVKVGTNLDFVCYYNYQYIEKSLRDPINEFAVLSIEGDDYFAVCDHIKTQLANPYNYKLYDKQIVALNSKKEIITFYKKIPFVLDLYRTSIIAKGHNVYVILKLIENGLIVKDLIDNTESFLVLDNFKRNAYEVIFLSGTKLINNIDNPRFYTLSNSYEKSKVGQLIIQGDRTYIAKNNGEIVLIKCLPENLQYENGQLVRYDEFNCYIKLEKEIFEIQETDESKILASKYKEVPKQIKEKFELSNGCVLIVGDIKLQPSYEKILNSEGYQVNVVSGFEAFHKITSLANSADIVVVVTEHASHVNYFMLKDKYNQKIIYTHNGGSNRVLEAIQNQKENVQSEVAASDE